MKRALAIASIAAALFSAPASASGLDDFLAWITGGACGATECPTDAREQTQGGNL